VAIAYQIKPEDRAPFVEAISRLAHARRRDGAYDWGIHEDVAHPGRYVETFSLDSWLGHLRRHQRVTRADREQQAVVNRYQVGDPQLVTHLVAPER
jgi:transmembrane secretion effector